MSFRIDEVMLIKLANEAVPVLLLVCLGFVLVRGLRKNQSLLLEREDLLRRYILFRGDKQTRLKVYGEDETVHRELLKTLSSSWKHFKKGYDEYLHAVARNSSRTRFLLRIVTVGLFINTARLLIEEYFFYGLRDRFLYVAARELSNYVPVVFSFILLRTQTEKILSLKGETARMDRETLFFPNDLSIEGGKEGLFNEFDPLEPTGEEDGKPDGKEDPDYHGGVEGRSTSQ
jgi:hypothetical protein